MISGILSVCTDVLAFSPKGESVANLLFQVLDGTNEIFKFIRLLVQNEIEETRT